MNIKEWCNIIVAANHDFNKLDLVFVACREINKLVYLASSSSETAYKVLVESCWAAEIYENKIVDQLENGEEVSLAVIERFFDAADYVVECCKKL